MRNILTFAAVLVATANPAHAGEANAFSGGAEGVERVPYQPSELATDEGIRSLQMRVRKAAGRVCATPIIIEFYAGPKCVKRAVSDAFAQLERVKARGQSDTIASAGTIMVRAS